MDWADLTNGLFELGGALLNWMNVQRIWRDREVKGVYWPAWAFFACWGWWNVYFYGPHLGQWFSWGAGIVMVASNTIWVALAVWFIYVASGKLEARLMRTRWYAWVDRNIIAHVRGWRG